MIRTLLKKWDDSQFDAMVKQRVGIARNYIAKSGEPTEDEIDWACNRFAREFVLRNIGREDSDQIAHIKAKIHNSRQGIQVLFQEDGYDENFARTLSFVCVAWDSDSYKKKRLKHNLTLNYLLKKHTDFGAFFTESLLLKQNS
jgi:hypothetical protein